MRYDLRPFVDWILNEFEPSARVDNTPGNYAIEPGGTSMHLYGTSDMACVLYTIGALHPKEEERSHWARWFQSLQDPQSGYLLSTPPEHGKLHNTAFALGAMKLLEIRPLHPLRFAAEMASRSKLEAWLDAMDWREGVYGCSHDGAGLASAFALAPGTVPTEWFGWYFDHLDTYFDANNGMLGRDKPPEGDTDQIGGTFHYAFLYEYFHRRMPCPEARVDAILGLQLDNGEWHPGNPWWMTLDALYLLTRGVRHCHHRPDDARAAVRRTVATCCERVNDSAARQKYFGRYMGVHTFTAAVSILAEAQEFLGSQEVITNEPLRLVLDKRPFI